MNASSPSFLPQQPSVFPANCTGLDCLIVRPYHVLAISEFECDLTEFWSLAFCMFLFFWPDGACLEESQDAETHIE
jgi:hypothetical protein